MSRPVHFAAVAVLLAVTSGCSAHPDHVPNRATVRSAAPGGVATFAVSSPDLAGGATFSADQYAHAFGCSGKNRRPALRWSGAPSRAKSFAVTVHDIDAPTGSGFWHDVVWDVPGSATSLGPTSPRGAVEGLNDAGQNGYLGPCPPAGDGRHRYVIDVYALDVPTLGAPASTPPAVANFMMHGHIVGKAELTATAKR